MIRALIFDFDGLIVDTETPLIEAWAQVHAHFQVPCPREKALQAVGHAEVDYDLWAAFPVDYDRAELVKLERQFRQQLLLAQPIRPGVEQLIASAKAHDIRLGVASNSPHRWVDHHLQRIGLFQYFDAVCCRDDVERGKPEPDVYRLALDNVGASPRYSVAFEDSPPGSEAARRAGAYCVVAPNPSTQHHLFTHADWRVNSLADVSLEQLEARLSQRRQ